MALQGTGSTTQYWFVDTGVHVTAPYPRTMLVWFKFPSGTLPISTGLVSTFQTSGNSGAYGFDVDSSSRIEAREHTDSGIDRSAHNAPPRLDGSWQAAIAAFVGTSSRFLYFRGLSGDIDTNAATAITTDKMAFPLWNPRTGTESLPTNAFIAHIALWYRQLTPWEMSELLSGTNPLAINQQALQIYLPLLRDLTDHGPNAYPVSASGGPTATWSDNNPPVSQAPLIQIGKKPFVTTNQRLWRRPRPTVIVR